MKGLVTDIKSAFVSFDANIVVYSQFILFLQQYFVISCRETKKMIDQITIARIQDAAQIVDVVSDFVTLNHEKIVRKIPAQHLICTFNIAFFKSVSYACGADKLAVIENALCLFVNYTILFA